MYCFAARDRTEKKLFGFSFVKLVADDGTTLCDGSHELFLYKVSEWSISVNSRK